MSSSEKKQKPAETIGERVSRLMAEREFTQTLLSEKSGIERTQLNRLIRGKRQVLPQEIPWLAEALGVTSEALMEGVDVPAPVKKAIDELAEVVRRVLAAERERDEAVLHAKEATRVHAEAAAAWGEERAELEKQVQELTKTLAKERENKSAIVVAHRHEADQLKQHAQGVLAASARENSTLRAQIGWYINRVQQLEQHVAAERADKAATVFGVGSLALLIGAGIGSSRS